MFSVHQADAHLCAKHFEIMQSEFSSQMKLLKETMHSKTAVPTAKAFVSVLVTYLVSTVVMSCQISSERNRSMFWEMHIPLQYKIRRCDRTYVCVFSMELDVLLVVFKQQDNRSSQMLGQMDTMYYPKKEHNVEHLPHLQDGPKN